MVDHALPQTAPIAKDKQSLFKRLSFDSPVLVIAALAILNTTFTFGAMQPILARYTEFGIQEASEGAQSEMVLWRHLIDEGARRSELKTYATEIRRGVIDPERCVGIWDINDNLVGGDRICGGERAKAVDVWGPESGAPKQWGKPTRWAVVEQIGPYRVVVGRAIDEGRLILQRMTWVIGLGVLLATLAQFLFWLVLGKSHQARVGRVAATARKIARGDLTARVVDDGPRDAFSDLGDALNAMADRFDRLSEAMRISNNAAAHDLRMPLTRVQSGLQRILDHRDTTPALVRAIEAAGEEVERAMAQFSAMNTIERAEASTSLDTMEIADLAEIATNACELFDPVLEDAGLLLDLQTEPTLALVQPQLLTQAIANLLHNAAKYAGGGKLVRVIVESDADGPRIIVSDNGVGVSAEDRPRILERFVRLDTARSGDGFGLGLSMVQSVAKLHGGSFHLEDGEPGLRCVIKLGKLV
jgi:signal transduction histidine kinase